MPKDICVIGKNLGELRVLGKAEPPEKVQELGQRYAKSSWWRCKCSCGKEVIKSTAYLRQSRNPSCGCRGRQRKMFRREIEYKRDETGRIDAGYLTGVAKDMHICATCKQPFDMYAGKAWAYKRKSGNGYEVYCTYGCMIKKTKKGA